MYWCFIISVIHVITINSDSCIHYKQMLPLSSLYVPHLRFRKKYRNSIINIFLQENKNNTMYKLDKIVTKM